MPAQEFFFFAHIEHQNATLDCSGSEREETSALDIQSADSPFILSLFSQREIGEDSLKRTQSGWDAASEIEKFVDELIGRRFAHLVRGA
ncbi:MAG: hypothetical protein WCE49_17625, partial [Terrimicrobiaceae bacterium]